MQILPPPPADFGFYAHYLSLAPQTDLVEALTDTMHRVKSLALSLSEEELDLRYAPGKWSVRENFAHLIDAERNFGYRIMRISRGDQGMLPNFDIHTFLVNAHAGKIDIKDLIAELEHLRAATILTFKRMTPGMLDLTGPARDITISVRALGFAMTGHMLHHIALIKERYLASASV